MFFLYLLVSIPGGSEIFVLIFSGRMVSRGHASSNPWPAHKNYERLGLGFRPLGLEGFRTKGKTRIIGRRPVVYFPNILAQAILISESLI